MKIWSISFNGVWPVGSAAIVCTHDEDGPSTAVELFRETWQMTHPQNDPGEVEATLLSVEPGSVHILADGDY